MKEPPLSNLISLKFVKPVNFEKDPFSLGFQRGTAHNQQARYHKQEGEEEFGRHGMKHMHKNRHHDEERSDEEFEVVKEKQRFTVPSARGGKPAGLSQRGAPA
jgi:hypothetical protein